ncbi:hypothetical protein GWI33_009107 [Rhynchophorus ferrugineus]|uniref:Uncharacterized protein n=1 Tax=Rhynchophorus ferrugineus TaxID=354439 RepID=A0A834IH78_RHYFE|nr:hypothetical protein GWI33_009107 [Rhynchophorus ferrugineus]
MISDRSLHISRLSRAAGNPPLPLLSPPYSRVPTYGDLRAGQRPSPKKPDILPFWFVFSLPHSTREEINPTRRTRRAICLAAIGPALYSMVSDRWKGGGRDRGAMLWQGYDGGGVLGLRERRATEEKHEIGPGK